MYFPVSIPPKSMEPKEVKRRGESFECFAYLQSMLDYPSSDQKHGFG
jgi:hypothetical protein